METTDIRLWCIIVNNKLDNILGDTFHVDLPPKGTVSDLKEKILLIRPSLQPIQFPDLLVWMCPGLDLPGDDEDDNELMARIRRLDLSKMEEAQRLHSQRRVSSLSIPPNVMLLVQLPEGHEYKRKHDAFTGTDVSWGLKRLKTETGKTSPSALAIPLEFRQITGPGHAIACNHPFEYHTIPLMLVHEAFGIFTDRCKAAPSKRALAFLNELTPKACEWYKDETQRRSAIQAVFLEHLGILFSEQKVPYTESTTGCLMGNVIPVAIRECTNEKGPALNQAILCYSGFLRDVLLNPRRPCNLNTCFPCILMVDVGSLIGFYGTAWDGERVKVEPLTPGLDLATHWKEIDTRRAIASCFDALVDATENIQAHYKSVEAEARAARYHPEYDLRVNKGRRFPFLTSYNDDGQETRFTYEKQLDEDKLVFSATVNQPGSGECIVKFTQQYSEAAHTYLASRGLAPRIRQCIRISANWTAVIMDKSKCEVLFDLPLLKDEQQKVGYKVKDIVRTLHKGGFVHGDIRNVNLLVDRASLSSRDVMVQLIDFDWAGCVGEVKYPMEINHRTVRRPEGVEGGELITEEHDNEMVSYLFAN